MKQNDTERVLDTKIPSLNQKGPDMSLSNQQISGHFKPEIICSQTLVPDPLTLVPDRKVPSLGSCWFLFFSKGSSWVVCFSQEAWKRSKLQLLVLIQIQI